jgi:hypothetical protein
MPFDSSGTGADRPQSRHEGRSGVEVRAEQVFGSRTVNDVRLAREVTIIKEAERIHSSATESSARKLIPRPTSSLRVSIQVRLKVRIGSTYELPRAR